MERIGVNWSKLVKPSDCQTVQEVLEAVEKIINITRQKFPNKDKPVTIIWDSLASTPSKAEIEGEYDPSNYMAIKAREVSLGMRKLTSTIGLEYITFVIINQIRTDLKQRNPYMDPTVTPGGKAVPFHSSVRIRVSHGPKIKNNVNDVVGRKAKIKIIKNRMSSPWRETVFPIYHYGIDNEESIYDFLHDTNIIKKTGGWSKIILSDEEVKFRQDKWAELFQERKEEVMCILDKLLIRDFTHKNNFNIDDESLMEMEQLKEDIMEDIDE